MSEFDIKKIRNELGLTQKELATELGVDIKTIQNWERGKRIPDSKDGILRKLILKPHQYAGGEQQNINGDNITTGTIRAVDYVAVGQIGDNDYSVFAVEDGADNRIGYIGYQFIQGDGDYADKLWIRTEEFGDWKPCIKIEAAGRVSLESTDISDGLIYIRSANAITLSADHLVQIEVNGTEWTFEADGLYKNGAKVL